MIVVTTPTGQIGRRVVELVLGAPEPPPVRVVTRDPDALEPGVRDRVQAVAGSHRDPAVLAQALDGADSVFWLVPPDPRTPGTATEHYLAFTDPACEALVRHHAMLLGHGVAEGWARDVATMVRAQNDGIYDAEPHLPARLSQPADFRSRRTDFRTWCERRLEPVWRKPEAGAPTLEP